MNEYIENENINKQKINQEPIFILGKKYDIIVKYENTTNPTLNLLKKYIEIILPSKYINIDKTQVINATISKMYKSLAKDQLESIMEDARHLLRICTRRF